MVTVVIPEWAVALAIAAFCFGMGIGAIQIAWGFWSGEIWIDRRQLKK